MLKPTLEMQEYIDNRSEDVNKLASKLWDAFNELDPDPMHPNFENFDDPIKDHYIAAASYLVIASETELLD